MEQKLDSSTKIQLCRLYADIDGDSRYADVLTAHLVKDGTVVMEVKSSSPTGGMDTQGSSIGWDTLFTVELYNAHPRDVMRVVKQCIDNKGFNFKRYGKPTKNMTWLCDDEANNYEATGVSLKLCEVALLTAKDIFR